MRFAACFRKGALVGWCGMKKLTGYEAIKAKERDNRLILCKEADPLEPARENLTVNEALAIAKHNRSLIYCMVTGPAWSKM
jgi:hypothetical protein